MKENRNEAPSGDRKLVFEGTVAQWAIEKEINSNHFIERLVDIIHEYVNEQGK